MGLGQRLAGGVEAGDGQVQLRAGRRGDGYLGRVRVEDQGAAVRGKQGELLAVGAGGGRVRVADLPALYRGLPGPQVDAVGEVAGDGDGGLSAACPVEPRVEPRVSAPPRWPRAAGQGRPRPWRPAG